MSDRAPAGKVAAVIHRRRFLWSTAGALLASRAFGQSPGRQRRIGVLHSAYGMVIPSVQGLKDGLKAAGFDEGRDVVFDVRNTLGGQEPAASTAAALVAARCDVLYANNVQGALALKTATRTIPIVFTSVGDPVEAGLVSDLAHPGGNVTGITSLSADLVPKRLEIVKALVPSARRVVAVYAANDPASAAAARKALDVASTLRLEVVARPVTTEDQAVRELKALRARDVVLAPLSTDLNISGLVLNLNLYGVAPAIFANAFWVRAGGLVSYGHDDYAEGVQAARLVARILGGTSPRDLPVEALRQVRFVLNRKTADFLKVSLPPALVLRADEVLDGPLDSR
jgi:ABC-type uncharacterized transport system substrate-binding protein